MAHPASINSATKGKRIFLNIFRVSTHGSNNEENSRHHNIANGKGKWQRM
ncbi:hypothetical protein GJ746_06120 [Klebsiella oxytoca]|uniref:Uncharacterized protein n=1 Tax=Klebsiella oxytoca TaxID=571 RepID=A0A6B8MVI3_KLEOX|nr:hypothetical protein GJ746_06120 [Klebsiella oxytoca]